MALEQEQFETVAEQYLARVQRQREATLAGRGAVENPKPREEPRVLSELGKGLARGYAGVAEAVGTGLKFVGAKELGATVESHWQDYATEHARHETIEGSIVDNPELMLSGSWWAAGLGEFVASAAVTGGGAGLGGKAAVKIGTKLVPVTPSLVNRLAKIGGVVGGGAAAGALESASTYNEVLEKGGTEAQARSATVVAALAIAGLNAIPLGRILPGDKAKQGAMRRLLGAGGEEALTEYLESPAESAVLAGLEAVSPSADTPFMTWEEAKTRAIEEANVAPLAFAMGAAGGVARPRVTSEQTEPTETETIPRTPVTGGAREPTEEAADAGPVRSDQGQAAQSGDAAQRGEDQGGEDLQQPAQAGTASGEPGVPAREVEPAEALAGGEPVETAARPTRARAAAGQARDVGGREREPGTESETEATERPGGRPRRSETGETAAAGPEPAVAPTRAGEEAPLRAPEGAATASAPIEVRSPADLQRAREAASTAAGSPQTQPTDAQKEAGNYAKAHIRANGLDIAIENPKGSTRSGRNKQTGESWSVDIQDDYGYIKRTVGRDKDHLDVFMTEQAGNADLPVFVVDQNKPNGRFDEHKVILGAASEVEARRVYQRNYEKGWRGAGGVKRMSQAQFKAWSQDAQATQQRAARATLAPDLAQTQAPVVDQKPTGVSIPEATTRGNEPTDVSQRSDRGRQPGEPAQETARPGQAQTRQPAAPQARAETAQGPVTAPKPERRRAPKGAQAYRRRRPPRGQPLDRAKLDRQVARARERWPGGPDVEVVATQAELFPEGVPAGTHHVGLYRNGRVYLVAENLTSAQDVDVVLAHEVVGHASLQDMLGSQWGGVVREVNRLAEGPLSAVSRRVMDDYGQLDADRHAAEVIAVLAERRVTEGPGARVLRQARELLRAFLSRLGLTRQFSVDDLNRLLTAAERRLRTPRTLTQGALADQLSSYRDRKPLEANADTLYGLAREDGEHLKEGSQAAYAKPNDQGGYDVVFMYDRQGRLRDQEEVVTVSNAYAARHLLHASNLTSSKAPDNQTRRAQGNGTTPNDFGTAHAEIELILAERGWTGMWRKSRELGHWGPFRAMLHRLRQKAEYSFLNFEEQQRIIAEHRGMGSNLPDDMDVVRAETLMHGSYRTGLDRFRENHLDPMLKRMEAVRQATTQNRPSSAEFMRDVERYLHAKHAKEANERLAKANPDAPIETRFELSGMSNEMAAQELGRLEGRYGQQNMTDLQGMVSGMTNARLDLLVEYGLETQQSVQALRDTYDFYVPLHRRQDLKEGEVADQRIRPGAGKGYSIKGKENQQRTGSTKDVENILAHVCAQYEQTLLRGEKNRVGQRLHRLAQRNKNANLWEIKKGTTRKEIDPATGFVRDRMQPLNDMHEHVVDVKINGEPVHIVFNERNPGAVNLARAMKKLGPPSMNRALSMVNTVTRFMSAMSTTYNPDFLFVNPARDIQTALYNLSTEEADIGKVKFRVVKGIPSAMKGISEALIKGKDATGEWAHAYRELEEQGGTTGWSEAHQSVAERSEKLGKLFANEARDGALSVRTIMRRGGDIKTLMESASTVMENAARLSVYRAALDKLAGGNPPTKAHRRQAASIAKNITVNFNRKGESTTWINAMYMFFNASVQGSMRVLKTVNVFERNARGKLRPTNTRAWKVLGTVTTMAMIADLYSRAQSGEDEEGKNYYDQIPSWVKERNMIIMTGEQSYIKIPMPYGFNVFGVMGQKIGEGMTSTQPKSALESAVDVWNAFAGAFDPMGGSPTLTQRLAPSVVDPFVQISENKNWIGRPIAREPKSWEGEVPEHMQYYAYKTSGASVAATKFLAETLGAGDEWQSGPAMLEWNPAHIDHLFGTLMGGVGTFFGRAKTTGEGMLGLLEEPMQVKDYPIAGRFMGEQAHVPTQQRQRYSQFLENRDSLRNLDRRVKGYKARIRAASTPGDRAEAAVEYRAVLKESKRMLTLKKPAGQLDYKLRKLNTAIRQVQGNGALSDTEKRRRIEVIRQKQSRMIIQFNKRFDALEDAA